jgi:hypothetical protein
VERGGQNGGVLHHVVLFQVPDPLQREELVRRLQALPGLIPEIETYEVGVDVSRGETSYDVGLYSTFADSEALEVYRAHHAHQAILQLIGDISPHRIVTDWRD